MQNYQAHRKPQLSQILFSLYSTSFALAVLLKYERHLSCVKMHTSEGIIGLISVGIRDGLKRAHGRIPEKPHLFVCFKQVFDLT